MTQRQIENLIIYHIHRISRQWGRQSAHLYEREFGLKLSEVWVLQLIGDFPETTVSQLTGRSHMDKPAISRAVSGLERKNLVVKKSQSEDRRIFNLALSPAGRDIYMKVVPLREERQKRLEERLDAMDREALFRAFDKIYAQLDQELSDE